MGNIPSSFAPRLTPENIAHFNRVIEDDPAVKVGRLSNGMRYFIRAHENPKNRAIFRFVMHIGSLEEDNDQQGLAHILEHMAFNGSTNFGPQELDAYFQSIGMQFGAHVNASTGFENTTYKLEIPTDDPEIFKRTFQVLRDWGDGLSMLSKQIEKERLVGLEEWRGRLSGQMRTTEQMLPTMFWGGKQVERLPIGTEESLKTFSHDALERFYQDWYRPDLCTLVVVGDIQVEEIEQYIQDYLADWTTESHRQKERTILPIHAERLFEVIQDDAMPYPMLMMAKKRPLRQYRTEGEWAWSICKYELLLGIVNERFRFMHRALDSLVSRGRLGSQHLSEGMEQEILHGVLDVDNWQGSIQELIQQVEQLKQFGITEDELARAKDRQITNARVVNENLPTFKTSTHVQNIMGHVLEGDPLWPEDGMKEITERWTSLITVDDINQDLSTLLEGDGVVVYLLTPDEGYTSDDLQSWIENAEAIEVNPYQESTTEGGLLDTPLTPGSIVSKRVNEKRDVHEWVFDNGVKIWLKDTDFDENVLFWRGVSHGGYSLVEDEDLNSAQCLNGLMTLANVGNHTTDDINRLMNAVPGRLNMRWTTNRNIVAGKTSREAMLPALNLLWLRSQASTFTEPMVEKVRKLLYTHLSNEESNPDRMYGIERMKCLYGDKPRRQPQTIEDIPNLTLGGIQRAYELMVTPLGAMHFAVVGRLDWEQMETVLCQTLGALPTVDNPPSYTSRDNTVVQQQTEHVFYFQDEPKAEVDLAFLQNAPFTDLQRRTAKLACLILNERLRKHLREEEAGTYHVSAGWDYTTYNQDCQVMINFGCNPERVDELKAKALEVVKHFVAEGVTEEEFQIEFHKQERSLEKSLQTNDFWLASLGTSITKKRELMEIPDQIEALKKITLAQMNAWIPSLYNLENYCHTMSLPKPDLDADA